MADDTKLYTLTVPNYSTKLLSELNCLRAKNLCCDVKICTDEGFLYAHKIVMCSVSPYFKERISLSSHEPDTIDVNNTNHHLLNCILNFVYTGTLQFNIIHLESIVQLLNKLEIKDLLAILGELKNSCKNGNDSTTDFDLNETPVIEWPKVNEVDQEPVAGEEDNSIMSKRKLYDDDTDIEQYEDNLGHVTNVDSPRESSVDMPTETLATIIQDKTDKKKSRKSLDKKRKLTTTQPRKKVPPVKISLKKMMDATIADDGVKVDIDSIPLDSSFSESQGDAEFETVGGYIVKVEPNDSTDDAPDYSKEPPTKKNIKPEMQSKSKQCKFCDEVFSNYKDYLVHRKTHVKGPDDVKKKRIRKKPYLCSVCSRAMSSAVRRACHEYSKHGIPYDSSFKLYTCTFEGCNYISANKRYVDNHMRGPHSDERPHICEYCGKAFKMPGALWTHTNIHTKQKEYKCEDCGMNFHQQSGLDIKSTSTKSEMLVSNNSSGETSTKIDDLSHKTSSQPYNSSWKTSSIIENLLPKTSTQPDNSSGLASSKIDILPQKTFKQPDKSSGKKSSEIDNSSKPSTQQTSSKIDHSSSKISTQPDISSWKTSPQQKESSSKMSTKCDISIPKTSTKPDKTTVRTSVKLDKLPVTQKSSTRINKLKQASTQAFKSTDIDDVGIEKSMKIGNSTYVTSTKEDDLVQQMPAVFDDITLKTIIKIDKSIAITKKDGSVQDMPPNIDKESQKSSTKIENSKRITSTKLNNSAQQLSTMIDDSEQKTLVKLFECEKCPYKSVRRTNLLRHLKSHENTESHLNCPKLSKQNPKRQQDYLCDKCAKTFKTKCGLTLHKKKHDGEYKYICDICNKGYNQSTHFRYHLATHQAMAAQCCYCRKTYIGHSSLKRHKNVCSLNPNTPKDIDRNLVCEECGQTFSSKDALSYHVKGKHGAASYVCNICGKAYAWRSSLRTHKALCMKKYFLISLPDTEN